MTQTVRGQCPYCGVGCGILMQVDNGRVTKVSGDKGHPSNAGRLCTKGLTCHQALTAPGRLQHAYLRQARGQEPTQTKTDEAIRFTAMRLRQLIDRHGPNALCFYVSGQMSLEAQYLANKLAKGFVGTNQIESNSRLCMASASTGYKLSLGADSPPGSYDDFEHADLFLVIGANMADCHPILYLRMLDRLRAGAKLIVVDPRRTSTAEKADLHLQIRAGSDLALLNGLLHLLHAGGHCDQAFIQRHCQGWAQTEALLADYPPQRAAHLAGIEEAQLRQAAQMIGQAKEWMSCWTMGINQSSHGTYNVNALCNLHLATGAICRPGSGPFSLTGQPNAMGGREMGYMGPGLPGQRNLAVAEERAFVEQLWGLTHGKLQPSQTDGTLGMFENLRRGRTKACWIICSNPVASVGNRSLVIEALQAAELVITQDAFLDTATNRYADVLLPGALWAEGDGVMVNSERNLTLTPKTVEPPGEALPDWQIIARIACEMGYGESFDYSCASDIFDELKAFYNPETGYDIRGLSHRRLNQGPVQWPCGPQDDENRHPIRYLTDEGPKFPTSDGKARFLARPHQEPWEMPDEEYPFVLNTGRLQHQWHTLTKTGQIAALNRLNPGPFVEINPKDAERLGLQPKDRLEIDSRRGRALLPAVISDRVRPGECFAPFHWNDVQGDLLAINAVTSGAVDPLSQQPELKACAVELTPVHHTADNPQQKDAFQVAEADPGQTATALAALGMPSSARPTLSPTQSTWLAGFIEGAQARRKACPWEPAPGLPAQAPFDRDTRPWVEGLIAGLFSQKSPQSTLDAASAGPPITLLWASQTGNAQALAEDFADRLSNAGLPVQLADMADWTAQGLAEVSRLLIITSTFGDGEAPDNGQSLWNDLQSYTKPLRGLRYAVLALGDSSYPNFCRFGRQLHERLEQLEAKPLRPCTTCDSDFEEPAEDWFKQVLPVLCEQPVAVANAGGPTPAAENASAYHRKHPFASRLLRNLLLNPGSPDKETRNFALYLDSAALAYQAGDALGVWPRNDPALVQEILTLANLQADQPVTLDGVGELPLKEAMERHLEIARPSKELLLLIAQRSADADLARRLQRPKELNHWLWGRQLADVLGEHPMKLSADEFLASLKPLQPRLYSISSSPKLNPQEVQLTVNIVRYGRRQGVASGFLADRAGEVEIPIFVQASRHFHLPDDGDLPVIMIGPGTGVAPFRAFLQERRICGDRGRNWLFFGERHQAHDFYYQDEILGMRDDGLLTRLNLAFSRDQTQKIYVQDRIRERGAELWRWLEEGARIYICGDASRMAKDVEQALLEVIARHGRLDPQAASDYLQRLTKEKRYLRDVY